MTADLQPGSTRFGRHSVLYAVCALVLVIGMFSAYGLLPVAAPEIWQSTTGTVAALAFFAVAPVLHIIGLIMGVRGLAASSDNKVLSVVGIVLNVGLFVAGLSLLVLILPAATAFR